MGERREQEQEQEQVGYGWLLRGGSSVGRVKKQPRFVVAILISADAGDGEGYLVYRNFCTLMRFNPAFKYALPIGLLSDMLVAD